MKCIKFLENNIKLVEDIMSNSEQLSTAEFEELCISRALSSFWNK